ncbi:MAG: hypothetical protein GY773_24395, partial [Actinomycetia bacterium]|nr:hypothetical protein [Actinomycetes bacterium]
ADIVHCHDNHTGILPAYLRDDGGPPTVFTIHNLAYHGLYAGSDFGLSGLHTDRFYGHSAFEFYGDFSLLKTGLIHADAITTADRLILFRLMIHTLAERQGRYATFMPKPFSDKTGNGLHLHISLWTADTDEPLFVGTGDDSKGLGLSELAYQFIGGLVTHARALVAVTNPIANSYKRMGVGAPTSGATWAPAYAAYGGNNRTQMIRIPEPDRIELRLGDGAANPYLALAAVLACGLDGIDNAIDPGEPNRDNLYALAAEEVAARGIEVLPPTLLHAVDNLATNDVLGAGLGMTSDGPYRDYYVRVKRDEFMAHHQEVTAGEVDQYLTMF